MRIFHQRFLRGLQCCESVKENTLSFDWSSFGSAITGAIAGGLIAGYFALESTKRSFKNQKIQAIENEQKLINGLLQAIHDEIETVYDRYQEAMGVRLETLDDGAALAFYYPLVSDFFSVYNGSTYLLGRIDDNDLRKQIIRTYTYSKGMVDSFRLNNDLVQKLEHSNKVYEETMQEIHKLHAKAHYNALVDYAKVLKQSHQVLKQEIVDLLRSLRKHGVLSEVGK
jgi:hypothetical protein